MDLRQINEVILQASLNVTAGSNDIHTDSNVLSFVDKVLLQEREKLSHMESKMDNLKTAIPGRVNAYIDNSDRLANGLRAVQDSISQHLLNAKEYESTLKPIASHLREPLLKLKRLQTVDKYVKVLQVVNKMVKSIDSALDDKQMQNALVLFENLSQFLLPVGPKMLNSLSMFKHLGQCLLSRSKKLKVYFVTKICEESKKIDWTDSMESSVSTSDKLLSKLKQDFAALIRLQVSYARLSSSDGETAYSEGGHIWALESFLSPLISRFQYHFLLRKR